MQWPLILAITAYILVAVPAIGATESGRECSYGEAMRVGLRFHLKYIALAVLVGLALWGLSFVL
jgi:hypothetical protein